MLLDDKQLWESVLVDIELSFPRAIFSMWFKHTEILRQEDGLVYVGVQSEFVKTWLLEKHHKTLLKLLREKSPGTRALEYVVSKNHDVNKKRDIPVPTRREEMENTLPFEGLYINKEDNLNPRYVFDSFVIGSFNELAYAAAQAIIKKPGIVYNPLYVFGDTGHGKTHLIQAIGNALRSSGPSRRIYYVTSEKFLMDYVNALQNNKVNVFKESYRKYDILIMDDVQFLSKKEKTQEELFHLFNHLSDNNKQIVFSSDKHPSYLPDVESRLRSRFSAGMVVEITAPETESRVAILRAKARQLHFEVSDETIGYLSNLPENNIRQLEGILNTIFCQAQLKQRELSLIEIKTLIKDTQKPRKAVSVKEVIKTVATFYHLDEEIIYEKTRRKEVVKPRQLIMYILREDLHVSYPTIGAKLGGRDHTTVIHSCDKVKNDLKTNNELVSEVEQIRLLLK
ncbi:MAG: chromosomal replication initiation protein [Parcubacteria group bacterium Gr01-1014_48]|nr:MAG: chromosomal replication initiation protein [Parcubacteria group bacterium Greene0416_14]TSC74324.1 MAG: chromosomal replication initiation protein [Parcubacteria group bacterium Gr01-1014_48]TSD01024.1 MAG: chromosomal replication initiation protein [Parcubacteria group bacterium Greene1014_15]